MLSASFRTISAGAARVQSSPSREVLKFAPRGEPPRDVSAGNVIVRTILAAIEDRYGLLGCRRLPAGFRFAQEALHPLFAIELRMFGDFESATARSSCGS